MTDLSTLYEGTVIPFLRPGPRPDRTSSDGWLLWRETLDGFTPAPRLSRREYRALSPRLRALYDLHRTATHANLRMLETPMSTRVSEMMQRRLQNNAVKWNPGTMDGLMVSGGGKQGKTETVCRAAAGFEELWRSVCGEMYAKPPPGTRDEFVPVAYCRLPVRARPKALCQSILDVFGDPHPATLHDLVRATRDSLRGHRTTALIIDDVTRLRLHREDDQDTLDLIREVMDLDVTLVLVGVDIPHSGLLRDAYYDPRAGQWVFPETKRGKSYNPQASTQTERRFDLVELDPFDYSRPSGINAFLEHLAGIEEQLRLLEHSEGTLTGGQMPEYLFRRTKGVIGLLNRLIEDACSVAISTGAEQLSCDLLERVTIRLSDLADLDPDSGEVPEIPVAASPRGAAAPRKRGRNTVFDDRGHRDASGA